MDPLEVLNFAKTFRELRAGDESKAKETIEAEKKAVKDLTVLRSYLYDDGAAALKDFRSDVVEKQIFDYSLLFRSWYAMFFLKNNLTQAMQDDMPELELILDAFRPVIKRTQNFDAAFTTALEPNLSIAIGRMMGSSAYFKSVCRQ